MPPALVIGKRTIPSPIKLATRSGQALRPFGMAQGRLVHYPNTADPMRAGLAPTMNDYRVTYNQLTEPTIKRRMRTGQRKRVTRKRTDYKMKGRIDLDIQKY